MVEVPNRDVGASAGCDTTHGQIWMKIARRRPYGVQEGAWRRQSVSILARVPPQGIQGLGCAQLACGQEALPQGRRRDGESVPTGD